MSYLSLYRKYRPLVLSEVVGQDHITQTLSNAIRLNKISHAYLFAGPRGTGKTSVAKILAKSLNCKDGPTQVPCGKCSACEGIAAGSFIDVLEIDAASNRGIDEIRDLKEKIHFSPAQGRTKVYIIDEVHMLTTEAFNALLKTLEEPPSHVVFILATTEPSRVLSTILSRCQRFDFKRIALNDLFARLSEVAKAESIKIDSEALSMIAKQAQGSLRDALGTLDQLASFTTKGIKTEDLIMLLGMSDSEALFEAADLISQASIAVVFGFVDGLVEQGKDPKQFTKDLIEHFRAIFIAKSSLKAAESLNVTSEALMRIKAQAEVFSTASLIRFLDIFSEAVASMRWETDGRLSLEMALVKAISVEQDPTYAGLISRLEALEASLKTPGLPGYIEAKTAPVSQKVKEKEAAGQRQAFKARGENRDESQPKENGLSEKEDKSSLVDVQEGEITLARVKRVWPLVLEGVLKESLPAHALLLESAPTKLANATLTLSFNWRAGFHKDMVEREKNTKILTDALEKVLGQRIKVVCALEEGPLGTSSGIEAYGAEEALGGENIIDMLAADLGAEIEES